MKRILIVIVAVFGLIILYLLFWPVQIDPAAWTPPEAPALTGVYEPNARLASIERLGSGAGIGPEDVSIDAQGRIYGGMEDGRIIRFKPDGGGPEVFADTGGRPVGHDFDAAGNLIVADHKGLLSVAPDGSITVLSTGADGVPFGVTDDLDVAADGTIYFSDASFKYAFEGYKADLLEHRPNGRLLSYDPLTRTTRLVLDKLYFANGVAVSPDQSFVLVNETAAYRTQRYWLSGPRKGESEIFIDNLPAFPDGISSNGKGIFWMALVAPRDPTLDATLPRPFLRKIIMRLPEALMPSAKSYGFVLGLDADGRVVHNLQDPSGSFAQITSVEENGGMIYLGSLSEDAIGRLPVPEESATR